MFQYRKSSAPVWLCFPDALFTGRQVCVTRTPTQPLSSPLHLAFLVSTSWGLLSSLPPAASSTFLSGTFYLCPPAERKNENKDREDQWWCEVEKQLMERRVIFFFRQVGSQTLDGDHRRVFSWWKKHFYSQAKLPPKPFWIIIFSSKAISLSGLSINSLL